jgi:ribosome-binding protein aMBF1 (putative translation factor)
MARPQSLLRRQLQERGLNLKTHDQLIMRLMRRPGVRAEVQRIEREAAELLDALLKARQEAGLTQTQVAKRMGTQGSAIARLARAGNGEAFPVRCHTTKVREGVREAACPTRRMRESYRSL